MEKVAIILVTFLVLMLAACQEDGQTELKGSTDQSNQPNTEEADSDNQTASKKLFQSKHCN
ncbi:hypothetical protein [Oceanobacillus sp. FSL H7-0719]|uniref:hypothetical protein n=1 Tax=Oceanobacillus sp. FSL H7-0719 TaxID=2954507 RepID=UPI003248E110